MIAKLLIWGRGRNLASAQGGILLGSTSMTLSSFLVYTRGPMGGEIRHAELLQNVTLSVEGMAWILVLWPELFGLISMCLAFFVILTGKESARFLNLRWSLLFLLLFIISFSQVLLVITRWPQISQAPEFNTVAWQCTTSVAWWGFASISLILWRRAVQRSAMMHVVLAVLVLMFINPIVSWESVSNSAKNLRLGYGLLLIGDAGVLCSAIVIWLSSLGDMDVTIDANAPA